jgi:hypothetical protein
MRFEFMYFHYSCRNLVVLNVTHRKIAFQNVHGDAFGRRKHLLSLCKYVAMFKLLLSFYFSIDVTDTNISAAHGLLLCYMIRRSSIQFAHSKFWFSPADIPYLFFWEQVMTAISVQ